MHTSVMAMEEHTVVLYFCPFPLNTTCNFKVLLQHEVKGSFSVEYFHISMVQAVDTHSRYHYKVIES